jgi:hypothetical protein
MTIELIQVASASRVTEEDWCIHVNGVSRGYLYRVTDGYAVGIDVCGKIEHHSIEPDKQAAIAFAEKHLS